MLKGLFGLRENNHATQFSYACLVTKLILDLALHQIHSASEELQRESLKGHYPSNIAKAKKVIADNITNPNFSLDFLAKESQISKFHLVRTFKDKVGISPIQYLNVIKLEQAMGRLKSESVKVSDLAMELGFGSFSAFNKAFKKQTQLSPTQFAKRS